MTADVIGREVLAGPTESTALGNLAVQLIHVGSVANIAEARAIIGNSFPIISYTPRPVPQLKALLDRWGALHAPVIH
ncbi:Rhamnulokinase [compost metagenome]